MDGNEEGHQLGNFHNYYTFHPVEERSNLFLPGSFRAIWESIGEPSLFCLLDVGCNDGQLSAKLLAMAKSEIPETTNIYMLGIDLDEVLIERASKLEENDPNLKFATRSISESSTIDYLKEYLSGKGCSHFSFLSLFSITMWIHLNVGDDGLKQALINCSHICNGSILIEPQPWKCYRTAAKRCRKLRLPSFPYPPGSLMIRDNIELHLLKLLTEVCLGGYWILGSESWGRSLFIIHHKRDDSKKNILESLAKVHFVEE